MSEPFIGEIAVLGFNFAPRGWAFCDGQILPINQNQALFSLLGTTYGGDGRTSFALPDLRGRVPIHFGAGSRLSSRSLGSRGGEESHGLSVAEMPSHEHPAGCQSAIGTEKAPDGKVPAAEANGLVSVYGSPSTVTLSSAAITSTGSGGRHDNMQPFLTLNFAIAITGLFPSRN